MLGSARDSEIMRREQRLSLEHKQVTQALLGGKAWQDEEGKLVPAGAATSEDHV